VPRLDGHRTASLMTDPGSRAAGWKEIGDRYRLARRSDFPRRAL